MEINDYLSLIKRKKQTIISLVVIFLVLGLILIAVQPFKYGSSLRLLVVQSASQTNLDPYAMTRSNEYISGVLAKVTTSNSFYQRVMNSGFDIDQEYFGSTAKQQAKKWNKTISARTLSDTGIIDITAYHQDRQQAEQLARAVGNVLMTQHFNYHGMDNSVKIKLLDEPITSSYPVQPNVILNIVLSIFLGLIFALSYVYLLPDSKYDIKLFGKKHSSQMIDEWLPQDDTEEQTKNSQEADSMLDGQESEWPAVEEMFAQNADNLSADNFERADQTLDLTGPMVEELSHEELEKFGNEWLNSPVEKPTEDQLYQEKQ